LGASRPSVVSTAIRGFGDVAILKSDLFPIWQRLSTERGGREPISIAGNYRAVARMLTLKKDASSKRAFRLEGSPREHATFVVPIFNKNLTSSQIQYVTLMRYLGQ
jgi:hypothetical protein